MSRKLDILEARALAQRARLRASVGDTRFGIQRAAGHGAEVALTASARRAGHTVKRHPLMALGVVAMGAFMLTRRKREKAVAPAPVAAENKTARPHVLTEIVTNLARDPAVAQIVQAGLASALARTGKPMSLNPNERL